MLKYIKKSTMIKMNIQKNGIVKIITMECRQKEIRNLGHSKRSFTLKINAFSHFFLQNFISFYFIPFLITLPHCNFFWTFFSRLIADTDREAQL